MRRLLLSETYMILLLNAVGEYTDISASQYSAGVVLGGIRDLLENGCVIMRPDGKLEAKTSMPDGYSGLAELYRNIGESCKSTGKWLDYYCCRPSSKHISILLKEIYASLAEKKLADIEIRKGIFRQKRTVSMCPAAAPVIEQFLKDAESAQADDNTVFCIQMLQLAEVLKKYFAGSGRMKSVLRQYSQTEIWRQMEPYVNSIRNFNYRNTVNSGAVYQ